MTEFDRPEADAPESDDDFAADLSARRPYPSAGFRSALRTSLIERAGKARWNRPGLSRQSLRIQVAGFAIAGSLMLMVAAIGVAGAGPLAA